MSTEGKLHLHAVGFDKNSKSCILIESKKFSNLNKKIAETKNDIQRMSHTLHHETLERGLGGFKIEQRYAVVLVDFWTEGKEKTMVYTTWPDYLDSGPFEITCHRGFENLVTDEEWKHNYKIMLAVKKL